MLLPCFGTNWQELADLAKNTASPDLEDIMYDRRGSIWAEKCPGSGASRNGRSHDQEKFGVWVRKEFYQRLGLELSLTNN